MYARVPQQTKILGAAKLTGRAGKFSFGALNATTADESAIVSDGVAAHARVGRAALELLGASARGASSPTSPPSASWARPPPAA